MAAPSATFMTDLLVNMTPDTVDVRTSSTVNDYGERTFSGSVATYDAYVRRITGADRGLSKDEAVVEWLVYILSRTLALAVDDEITLPAPLSGIRPIVKVTVMKDNYGQVGVTAHVGQKSSSR